MATLVFDPLVEERIKAEREASGADRYDEVWEGVYMMAPLADDEHQDVQTGLAAAIHWTVQRPGLGKVRAGVNVSDREEGWVKNYRIPDVAVFLAGSSARNCRTHWVGGPDFAVEIVSPGDRSREKLDFYSGVGVRELLVVDRDPWELELYRLTAGRLAVVGASTPGRADALPSDVVPLSFRLLPGQPRPQVEVAHHDGVQRWLV